VVKVYAGTDEEYYMDGILFQNLTLSKEKNKDDWDFVWVVDGVERGGKSVFAQQVAKVVDSTFNIDRIVFTPKQFEDAVKKAEINTAIVYDEGFGGLSARASMSMINMSLVKMLTEIGFKNLFIIICLPSFFDLDRYVALWRSRALFHIYTGDNMSRGFFKAYNYEAKKFLYLVGKKLYDYKVANPNFYGRFTKRWVVDKDLYNKKKREAVLSVEKSKAFGDRLSYDDWFNIFFRRVVDVDIVDRDKISLLGISRATYYNKLRLLKNESI